MKKFIIKIELEERDSQGKYIASDEVFRQIKTELDIERLAIFLNSKE